MLTPLLSLGEDVRVDREGASCMVPDLAFVGEEGPMAGIKPGHSRNRPAHSEERGGSSKEAKQPQPLS